MESVYQLAYSLAMSHGFRTGILYGRLSEIFKQTKSKELKEKCEKLMKMLCESVETYQSGRKLPGLITKEMSKLGAEIDELWISENK